MLNVPVEIMMDDSQLSRWQGMCDILRFVENPQDDDPWMFHGTSQLSAHAIDQNGFDPSTSWISLPDGAPGRAGACTCGCVFWTTSFGMAENFARKHARASDTLPAFLVARLSNVISSGTPVADLNTWAFNHNSDIEMRPKNWIDSLQRLQSIAVLDCKNVPNLGVWSIVPLDRKPDTTTVEANLAVFFEQVKPPRP